MGALHAKQMYVPIKPLEVVQSSLHNGDPFKGAGHVNLQLSLNEVQSYSHLKASSSHLETGLQYTSINKRGHLKQSTGNLRQKWLNLYAYMHDAG